MPMIVVMISPPGSLRCSRGDTVHGTYDQSRQVIADLEELGISYEDVVSVLEDEGVAKFEASWNEMLETIRTNMERWGA